MISRIARLVAFEWRKLAGRRLALVALLLAVLVAVASPIAGHVVDVASSMAAGRRGALEETQNAWTTLASGLRTGLAFAVIVVLVLSGSAIAEESQLGTLKAIFVRPVRRTELLLAKWVALASFAVLLLAVMALAAAGASELRFGFGDVTYPDYPEKVAHAKAVMASYTLGSLGLVIPSLIALVAFGLLFSCAIDHAGYAVGAAIGSFLLLGIAAAVSRKLARFLFTSYVGKPLEQLGDISEAINVATKEFREQAPAGVAVSLASALVFFLGAAWLLRTREISE